MEASQAMIIAGAAVAVTPVVLGVLGWSLRRNVKNADARDEETRKIATAAADRAEKFASELVEAIREEISRSGEETRQAVTALGEEVRTLSGTLGRHGERLAGGDVKLDALGKRVDGLEERERTRGCFPGCIARSRGDLGGGG